jgi:uncharacterized membrane protein
MLQILLLAVSVGLVVLGVKGFTASGIPFSKNVVLNGTSGKIVGAICIMAGLAFIPLFLLAFWLYANRS